MKALRKKQVLQQKDGNWKPGYERVKRRVHVAITMRAKT